MFRGWRTHLGRKAEGAGLAQLGKRRDFGEDLTAGTYFLLVSYLETSSFPQQHTENRETQDRSQKRDLNFLRATINDQRAGAPPL